jgi:hypothetical protein
MQAAVAAAFLLNVFMSWTLRFVKMKVITFEKVQLFFGTLWMPFPFSYNVKYLKLRYYCQQHCRRSYSTALRMMTAKTAVSARTF